MATELSEPTTGSDRKVAIMYARYADCVVGGVGLLTSMGKGGSAAPFHI